jgi:Leucine-rich repeat (LRR) protein
MNYNLLEDSKSITRIDISFGHIKNLPILPLKLEMLYADNNFELEEIPQLPMCLRVLSICLTGVQELVGLPETLEELYISENPGIYIDKLPTNLKIFVADLCELEFIPSPLPKSLLTLSLDANYLEKLPELPSDMEVLIVSNNQIVKLSISTLPPKLSVLNIKNNLIKSLPSPLPSTLIDFNCSENNLKKIPDLPSSVVSFVFFGNPLVYEFNKEIKPQDYVNRTNRFIRFMASLTICKCIYRYWLLSRIKNSPTFSSNVSVFSMSSNHSSYASFSSIDRWTLPDPFEEEFILI